MTDITELAQSLKAAAEKAGIEKWQVKRNGPGEYEVMVKGSLVKHSGWSTHRPIADEVVDKKTADFIAKANPANILALVEALEKSESRLHEVAVACATAEQALEKAQAQSSKWLEAFHKAVSIGARYEKRIAELESRTVTAAATDVLAERQRQITAEGWTPEHDDEYQHCEMAVAAACYIMADDDPRADVPELWPWSSEWWKPTDVRRDLVKAGALILAEIERLDREAGIREAE